MGLTLAEATRAGIGHFHPDSRGEDDKAKDGQRLEPGTIITEFVVKGRSRPWTVPYVRGRATVKRKPIKGWQARVIRAAKRAMRNNPPYGGPVELQLWFNLATKVSTLPDVTNLVKGTEDALQGVVIRNDRQVTTLFAERRISNIDCTMIRVMARD